MVGVKGKNELRLGNLLMEIVYIRASADITNPTRSGFVQSCRFMKKTTAHIHAWIAQVSICGYIFL